MGKEHYIREHMTAAGVGIVELSRRLGMHRQTVHTAIDKSNITLQTLYRIAAALNVPAHLLLLPPDAATQLTTGRTAGKIYIEDTHTETHCYIPPLHHHHTHNARTSRKRKRRGDGKKWKY